MAFEDFKKTWTVNGSQYNPNETVTHDIVIGGTVDVVTVRCIHDTPGHPYGNGSYKEGPPERIEGPGYVIKLQGKNPNGKAAIQCAPAPSRRPADQTPSWTAEDKG